MSKPTTSTLAEIKAAGARWGLDDFVEVVNSLVERYLPASRDNDKLRDLFNPRLVRYYATFGLISPPEREGKEARYHYGHLLQALVIRRLLFEGYTAPVLLKLLAGKTEDDYEAVLVSGKATATADGAGVEIEGYVAEASRPEHRRLVRDLMTAAPPRAPAVPAAAVGTPPPIPVRASKRRSSSSEPPRLDPERYWRRLEIAAGLELQIREDFVLPAGYSERETLMRDILNALAS